MNEPDESYICTCTAMLCITIRKCAEKIQNAWGNNSVSDFRGWVSHNGG